MWHSCMTHAHSYTNNHIRGGQWKTRCLLLHLNVIIFHHTKGSGGILRDLFAHSVFALLIRRKEIVSERLQQFEGESGLLFYELRWQINIEIWSDFRSTEQPSTFRSVFCGAECATERKSIVGEALDLSCFSALRTLSCACQGLPAGTSTPDNCSLIVWRFHIRTYVEPRAVGLIVFLDFSEIGCVCVCSAHGRVFELCCCESERGRTKRRIFFVVSSYYCRDGL